MDKIPRGRLPHRAQLEILELEIKVVLWWNDTDPRYFRVPMAEFPELVRYLRKLPFGVHVEAYTAVKPRKFGEILPSDMHEDCYFALVCFATHAEKEAIRLAEIFQPRYFNVTVQAMSPAMYECLRSLHWLTGLDLQSKCRENMDEFKALLEILPSLIYLETVVVHSENGYYSFRPKTSFGELARATIWNSVSLKSIKSPQIRAALHDEISCLSNRIRSGTFRSLLAFIHAAGSKKPGVLCFTVTKRIARFLYALEEE